eukprot:c15721_g1_i2 orf=394-714(-)
MTKRKKHTRSKNGLVSMDVCENQETEFLRLESEHEDMDTTEVSITALKVKPSRSAMKKQSMKRRAQRLRKEKAIQKALSTHDKQQEKLHKDQLKTERVWSMKKLYQ